MRAFRQLVLPYLIWSVLMLVLPMVLIVFYSFIGPGNSVVSLSLIHI